jgi:hypothetical protein
VTGLGSSVHRIAVGCLEVVWWWRPLAGEGDPQLVDDVMYDLIVSADETA